jgi:hypothetical protein
LMDSTKYHTRSNSQGQSILDRLHSANQSHFLRRTDSRKCRRLKCNKNLEWCLKRFRRKCVHPRDQRNIPWKVEIWFRKFIGNFAMFWNWPKKHYLRFDLSLTNQNHSIFARIIGWLQNNTKLCQENYPRTEKARPKSEIHSLQIQLKYSLCCRWLGGHWTWWWNLCWSCSSHFVQDYGLFCSEIRI